MRGSWVSHGTVTIRLGRPHFAFFRGYLEGLDISALAARYVPPETLPDGSSTRVDQRSTHALMRWIRKQLLVAARRNLPAADARLLGIAPEALLAEIPVRQLTLEHFREERDPYGMYGEAELIALFEETHSEAHAGKGSERHRRAIRNQRLRTRQQRALQLLENLVATDPALDDRVDGWLDPTLAKHLEAAGIHTIANLVASMDRYGYRWYTKVPRIGVKAALHISRWLQQESVGMALGIKLRPDALVPPKAVAIFEPPLPAPSRRFGIVVLERLLIPPSCIPAALTAPEGPSFLPRDDDVAAIASWLGSRQATSHTQRAYRRECERFLLWTLFECGKSISALTSADCARYPCFLAMLGNTPEQTWAMHFRLPQEKWLGSVGVSRKSDYWKPFHGSLSLPSQRQALIIVRSFLQWLLEQNYLREDLISALVVRARGVMSADPKPTLKPAEWKLVHDHLIQFAKTGSNATFRARFIFVLAHDCGLRLSELSRLRWCDLTVPGGEGASGTHAILRVIGRAGHRREVVVGARALTEMRAYLRSRGYSDLSTIPADAPLIASLQNDTGQEAGPRTRSDASLTAHRIYRIVKRTFHDVAQAVETVDTVQAERLRSASMQWLRHSIEQEESV